MDFLNWLPWLGLGGVGMALYVLGGAAVLGTLNSALGILAPIATGAKEFVSWYFSNLWDGIKVVMANASTFLVIATIAAGTGYYTMHQTKKIEVAKCETKITKSLPKKKLYKKPLTKRTIEEAPVKEWYDPLGLL